MIVKVCGLREAANIRDVETVGADWMGFVCYPKSLRYVAGVPDYLPRKARRVGVFVDATLVEIMTRVGQLGLDTVQLHGGESPALCRKLHSVGLRVIKAFALRRSSDLAAVVAYDGACDYYLFDTPCVGYGGSGRMFDWELLSGYGGPTPFLLSGGLRPASFSVLREFHHPCWAGIDLNSGFETAPGVKDAAALADFIEQFKKLHL